MTTTSFDHTITLGAVETPMGAFGAAITNRGLARLTFPSEPLEYRDAWVQRRMPRATRIEDTQSLRTLGEQLTAYLEGDLQEFTIPVDLRGTPFQLLVWDALQDIGYGQVRSYGDIATAIGSPRAVRAVGMANGANPVPIIVPCHRVIGSNGTLTGYGGGLILKEELLRLESGRARTAA